MVYGGNNLLQARSTGNPSGGLAHYALYSLETFPHPLLSELAVLGTSIDRGDPG